MNNSAWTRLVAHVTCSAAGEKGTKQIKMVDPFFSRFQSGEGNDLIVSMCYLQKSSFMPTINYPIHIGVAHKKANYPIWNDRNHLKQKLPIIFFNTRITSQVILSADWKLIAEKQGRGVPYIK